MGSSLRHRLSTGQLATCASTLLPVLFRVSLPGLPACQVPERMHVNDGNDINHGPPKGEPDVARIRCIQCHRVDKTLDAPNQNNVRCSLLWAQDIGSLTYFQQRIQQQCGVVSTFLGVREMTTPFVACMDYSPESHCIDKIHVCPKIRIVGKLTSKVASRNLACIVVCIGANQKNQPNLDLYLVRGFTICHFPIVVSYLCIGQSQKNQPNFGSVSGLEIQNICIGRNLADITARWFCQIQMVTRP